MTSNSITGSGQMNLAIEKQVEIDGVGMGVLSNGDPYLTGRGLARLCGVDNSAIVRLGADWEQSLQKPRVSRIKSILSSRGLEVDNPFIYIDGDRHWVGGACTAVLEYYAFDASQSSSEVASRNYRILAGDGFQRFVYTQVGYDPNNSVPAAWSQFHDRVSLTYDSVPNGYFSVFKEIADMIVTLGQAGLHIDSSFVPDISVGMGWAKHWKTSSLGSQFGDRVEYQHNYPDYFPQAASNPQSPWAYPESALGEFRRWFREIYIGEGKFTKYLQGQSKVKSLPASFSQLAISAYESKI